MFLLYATLFPATMFANGGEFHDLEASLEPLSPPHHLTSGKSTVINMTIYNRGDVTEQSVYLQLLINSSVVVDSTVANLSAGGFYRSSYFWDPSRDGVYNLTAYVEPVPYEDNINNNVATTLVKVCPDQAPKPNFTYSPPPPPPGPIKCETVIFNASTSHDPDWGEIVEYRWDFGDKNITKGNFEIITHRYQEHGDMNVNLTLFDSEGLNSSVSKSIKVYARPIPSFHLSPGAPYYVNQTLTFDASGSKDLDGNIESYFWEFGDGITSPNCTVNHSYSQEDSYTARLYVTDNDNLTAISPKMIKVDLGKPEADFNVSGLLFINQTLTFDASASKPNGEKIVEYRWDFDDKNKTTVFTPTTYHTYNECGTYNVTLIVMDSEGIISDPKNKSITIEPTRYILINITLSKNVVGQGYKLRINATAENRGIDPETFSNMTIYANTTKINKMNITVTLNPNSQTVLNFTWFPNETFKGNYVINATIESESYYECKGAYVFVGIPGDIDANHIVELMDFYLASDAYGSVPSHPRWNPNCDINDDQIVDLMDFFFISKHFGEQDG